MSRWYRRAVCHDARLLVGHGVLPTGVSGGDCNTQRVRGGLSLPRPPPSIVGLPSLTFGCMCVIQVLCLADTVGLVLQCICV